MSDYIKRDVLVQLFMDELLDEIPFSLKRELAEKMADTIPKVDAVEVVRCKDCKHWDSDCRWCESWGDTQLYDNGYCSYGERKNDERK